MQRAATFDATGTYRYSLIRTWEPSLPHVCFVMLNPSVADAERDDPTIRRCLGFARMWGYGSLEVVNLFAFCATRPTILFRATDPIGSANDHYIREAVVHASLVVAAWGNHGSRQGRTAEVLPLLRSPYCLGVTAVGQPCHPLYLRSDRLLSPLISV